MNPTFKLLQAYSALKPQRDIQLQEDLRFEEIQEKFVLLLDFPHLREFPPAEQYQRTFWKWAIGYLEQKSSSDDAEVDPRIYLHYTGLLTSSKPQNGPPSPSYVTHYWNSGNRTIEDGNFSNYHTATLMESQTTVQDGTTGLRTWQASFVLAQYLLSYPEYITGKRILELGSGTGFLGIILGSLQHQYRSSLPDSITDDSTLWLTDVNEHVLASSRRNVDITSNQSSKNPSIHFHVLDWFSALDQTEKFSVDNLINREIRPDVILGADIVFDPSLIPALVSTVHLALRNHPPSRCSTTIEKGRQALISLTVRNESTMAEFLRQAGKSVVLEAQYCIYLTAGHCIYSSGAVLQVKEIPYTFDRDMFVGKSETGANTAAQIVKIFRLTSPLSEQFVSPNKIH